MAWHIYTREGRQIGPIEKAELDRWIAEGRLSEECQVYEDGWEDWRGAADVFPQIRQMSESPRSEEPSPFSPPASPYGSSPSSPHPSPGAQVNPFAAPMAAPGPATASAGTYAQPAPTDGLAIASLVLGIVAVVFLLFACLGGWCVAVISPILSIIGLILGLCAPSNLKIAGIVLNLVALLPIVVGLILFAVGIGGLFRGAF